MKKIWLLVLPLIIPNLLIAQIEQYSKKDLLRCVALIIEQPRLQSAFEKDFNYQNDFNVTLREKRINSNRIVQYQPMQLLLEQIDQTDLNTIDNRFYLIRERTNLRDPNEEHWTADNQRRNIGFTFEYDEDIDVFKIRIGLQKLVNPNRSIGYSGHFQFKLDNGNWKIISDKLLIL
ncbi:MAG: hypothetical protein AB8G22_27565 [Saprospiraceae bacterium]